MSIIRTNQITNTAGTGSPIIPGGVLQVKYFQLTTSQTETYPTANTDKAITNFVVNITPKSTSSIMKIESNVMYESANSTWDTIWFFMRDSTKLGNTEPSSGLRNVGISIGTISHHNNDNATTPENACLTYFDAPSTTSAINYKLAVRTTATNNIFINRTIQDSNDVGCERGVSFMSVTEIGG